LTSRPHGSHPRRRLTSVEDHPRLYGEYTAEAYAKACRRLGVGAVDRPGGGLLDNAAAEAFNSIIKVEYIHRHRFRTRSQARLKITT
jgi:transposase InsO family protein